MPILWKLRRLGPKNLAKIWYFFAEAAASFCKKLIKTLFFEKHAIFSPKIVKNRRN
jgi:hypothetical protein